MLKIHDSTSHDRELPSLSIDHKTKKKSCNQNNCKPFWCAYAIMHINARVVGSSERLPEIHAGRGSSRGPRRSCHVHTWRVKFYSDAWEESSLFGEEFPETSDEEVGQDSVSDSSFSREIRSFSCCPVSSARKSSACRGTPTTGTTGTGRAAGGSAFGRLASGQVETLVTSWLWVPK